MIPGRVVAPSWGGLRRRAAAVLVALAVVQASPLLLGWARVPDAVGATTPAAAAAAPRSVLIIGDSTTVHMRSAFEAALVARGLEATIDAVSGRTVLEGRRALARHDMSAYDYVVVLLGANGRRASSARNMRALRAAGVDTVATVQAPEQRVVNDAIRATFGRARITWAGHATRLGIRTTDGKHYTRAAYNERARYLAREIAERAG